MTGSDSTNGTNGTTFFAFSFTPFTRILFRLLGIGPTSSDVIVTDTAVSVRMGRAFTLIVPRASIRSATRSRKPFGFGFGVHGKRGTWVVNGSNAGIVELALDPAPSAKMAWFPIRPHTLYLSLEEPDRFFQELQR